ncbi:hypothetical protein E4U55_007871 [Claviceps digitariae]|nr:hypothetical protein E4U55_007871 [Claviceps digitariae]
MRWRRRLESQATASPETVPPEISIDEEKLPGYNPRHYYPANPGDVLSDRFKLIAKLGWGSSSTVWLAQDISRSWMKSKRYVAIKICNCDLKDTDMAHERDMNFHLASANRKHPGRPALATAFDFKLDNIMIALEDQDTIDRYVQAQATHPMARKIVGDLTIYRCHNNFGSVLQNAGNLIPQVTDFGLAQRGDKSEPLIHPIQPTEFRAPEVILGTGWTYSADIWNFGAMIWELLAGSSLFSQPKTQQYSAAQHLADMISLLGEIPPLLVQRERDMRHWKWSPAVNGPGDRLYNNAAELFGGPFFDDDGKFMYNHLVNPARSLENELPECIQKEQRPELFIAFIKKMLCWLPEKRATASELLSDPWLESRHECPAAEP